jgi:hypothetical protein
MAVKLYQAGEVDRDLRGFHLPTLESLPKAAALPPAKPGTLRRAYGTKAMQKRVGKAAAAAYVEFLDEDYINMAWRGVGQLAAGLKRALTPQEKQLVFAMIYYAAEWGFRDGARFARGQKLAALKQATPSRKSAAQASHERVRAAFAKAARAGCDVDVDAICRECKVSRATFYRAMKAKPTASRI